MNILYLLSQKPDSTGSGFYTRALIAKAVKAGHRCSLVSGASALDLPDTRDILAADIRRVTFDRDPLTFPIPGMSDVMPYASTRFADLDRKQRAIYEQRFGQAVVEMVDRVRPDIIHSNHLWLLTSVARRLFPHIPMVASCHGTDLRQFRNCPHIAETLQDPIRNLDAILALSLDQKKEIEKLYGVDSRKITVVPNGFHGDIFYPDEKKKAPPVVLLYAGKLALAKGVPLLLETLTDPRLKDLSIQLYLAGSGTGMDAAICHDLGRKLGNRVMFLGPLSPGDLAARMRQAHLFVLPSFYEGMPLVIIESLASGCRLVAMDLPGIRELVSGMSGDWGELVTLPQLETMDRPFAADLPEIRNNLAQAIERQVLKCLNDWEGLPSWCGDLRTCYSWDCVFARVESVYLDLV